MFIKIFSIYKELLANIFEDEAKNSNCFVSIKEAILSLDPLHIFDV